MKAVLKLNSQVYVDVNHINEVLDKAGLYFNVETDELMGIGKSVPKARVDLGNKLPPPSGKGLLEEFLESEDEPKCYNEFTQKYGE